MTPANLALIGASTVAFLAAASSAKAWALSQNVVQLVAVNVIALAVFGERLSPVQFAGIVWAIVAIGMITLSAGHSFQVVQHMQVLSVWPILGL